MRMRLFKVGESNPILFRGGFWLWYLDDLKQSLSGNRSKNLLILFSVGAGTLACSLLLGIHSGLEGRAEELVRHFGADTALLELKDGEKSVLTEPFVTGLKSDFPESQFSAESVRHAVIRGRGSVPFLFADANMPQIRNLSAQRGRLLDEEDMRSAAPFAVGCQSLGLHPGEVIQVGDHVLSIVGSAALEGQIWVPASLRLFPEMRDAPVDRLRVRTDRLSVITGQVRQRHAGAVLRLTTQEELLRETRRWQRLILLGGGAVAALFFLLGGVGLMSVMMLSVQQRRQEIGLRLAMGARETDIFLLFVGEGLFLCVVAGFGGLLLAIGISIFPGVPPEIPFENPASQGWLPVLISCFIGAVFSCGPALYAAGQAPARILRSE